MLWSKASTPCAKSWHPCSPKPVNWGIWALTPCRAAPHSRMPTCAATNVSSKPFTESCTPLISTCFPRTADGAGVQNGSNAYKSSILRPFLSSPISFSKASGDIRRQGKRRAGSKSTPIFMPTSLCPPISASPRRPKGSPLCSAPPTTIAAISWPLTELISTIPSLKK